MTTIITNVSCRCGWTERLIHEHADSITTLTTWEQEEDKP